MDPFSPFNSRARGPTVRKTEALIAAIGIKRLGIAAAALVAAVLTVPVTLSLVIPAETVRDQVKAEMKRILGQITSGAWFACC